MEALGTPAGLQVLWTFFAIALMAAVSWAIYLYDNPQLFDRSKDEPGDDFSI